MSFCRQIAALTPAPQTGKLRAGTPSPVRLPSSVSIPDPRDTASTALEPGETLVWAGRPDAALLAWRQFDLKAFLLSTPAAIVAVILIWQAAAGGFSHILDYLFVLAAIAAAFVAALPMVALLRIVRRARSTVYAVTDRRIFILELFPRRRLRPFASADIETPRVRERGNGRGDVIFGWGVELEQTRQGGRTRLREATFFGIADPQQAAAQIAKLKSRAQKRRTASERTA